MPTACPATMCPLFAATGSPWTGEHDARCDMGPPCGFWREGCCQGCREAGWQVAEVADGLIPLQLIAAPKLAATARALDCPRAAECQWQAQSSPKLCPPREALARGIDPRVCAY
jgi:hypothetical protein